MDRRCYLVAMAVPVSFTGLAGCATLNEGTEEQLATAATCLSDAIDELERYADEPHEDFDNDAMQTHLAECKIPLENPSEDASTSANEDRIQTLENLTDVLSNAFRAIDIGVDGIVALDDGAAAVDSGGQYRPSGPVEEIGQTKTLRLYDNMRAELLTANEQFRHAISAFGDMAREMAAVEDDLESLDGEFQEFDEIDGSRTADAVADLKSIAGNMRDFTTAFLHYVNASIVSNEQGRINLVGDAKYVNGVLAKGPDPQTNAPSYGLAQDHFQRSDEILATLDKNDVLSGFRPWYDTLTCQLPHQIEATGYWEEGASERGHEAENRAFNQC